MKLGSSRGFCWVFRKSSATCAWFSVTAVKNLSSDPASLMLQPSSVNRSGTSNFLPGQALDQSEFTWGDWYWVRTALRPPSRWNNWYELMNQVLYQSSPAAATRPGTSPANF